MNLKPRLSVRSSRLQRFENGDQRLHRSAFGILLAIHWPQNYAGQHDAELVSLVNLFRAIFAFLSDDPDLLAERAEDVSLMRMKQPKGDFQLIDENGRVEMRRLDGE